MRNRHKKRPDINTLSSFLREWLKAKHVGKRRVGRFFAVFSTDLRDF